MDSLSAYRRRTHAATVRPCSGFTLLELMITLVIAMVLLMIAVPNLRHMILSSNLTDINNSLSGGLQFARTEAVSRQTNVAVAASAGQWQNGWLVEIPAVGSTAAVVLRRYPAIGPQYVVNAAAATSVTYQPQGSLQSPVDAVNGTCFTVSAVKNPSITPHYLQVMPAGMLNQVTNTTPPSSSCPKPSP